MNPNISIIYFMLLTFCMCVLCVSDEEEPQRVPTKCEVCKILVSEVEDRLHRTSSHDRLEMGRFGQQQKKAVKYNKSETRLIEVLDEVCDQVLLYKVHAERQGSLRYAKGESETMRTLKGLKAKGVKVELGIPDEMWESPHAEISQVKKMCELMREEYEEDIENWFFYHDDEPLTKFLCSQKVLSKDEDGCLSETLTDEKSVDTPAKPKSKTKRKHRKGDDGRNGLKDEL